MRGKATTEARRHGGAHAKLETLSNMCMSGKMYNGAMPAIRRGAPISVHPGDILREMLEERDISQSELARNLKTDVARINEIWRHRRGISAQMAVMLGRAFGTSAQLWLNLQNNWELSQVDNEIARHVRPLRKSA